MNKALLSAAALLSFATPASAATHYIQTNLVTDDQQALADEGFAPALTVDPDLRNPWGMSYAPTGPFWVSNQQTGNSTLYTGTGTKLGLTVSIPGAGPPAGPTGQLFAGPSTSFKLPSNNDAALFLFANLDGSISGWNQGAGTAAQVLVNPQPGKAVYTGLATTNSGGKDYLLAANNQAGKIDIFDSSYAPATLTGSFTDPGANPAGLAPFNVKNLGGKIYVTYATPGPTADEAPLGSGFVSVFNTDGTFVKRLINDGPLASPWGVALAPSDFGSLSNRLLVGNFNDELGFINVFDQNDGTWLGQLLGADGKAAKIPYLWELKFGNGATAGPTNQLFFAAGIGDEEHGLFGQFSVPEPATWAMMIAGFGLVGSALRRRRAKATVSYA